MIKIAARLFDKAFMDLNFAEKDMSQYGVFARDTDAPEYMTNKQGVLAGLQIQHTFEEEHDEADCRRIIDEYTRCGKDGGVTVRSIREACGLPAEEPTSGGGVGHLLSTSQEIDAAGEQQSGEAMQRIYEYYVGQLYFAKDAASKQFIYQATDYYTQSSFQQKTLPDDIKNVIACQGNAMKRSKALWDALCKDTLRWTVITHPSTKILRLYPKVLSDVARERVFGRPEEVNYMEQMSPMEEYNIVSFQQVFVLSVLSDSNRSLVLKHLKDVLCIGAEQASESLPPDETQTQEASTCKGTKVPMGRRDDGSQPYGQRKHLLPQEVDEAMMKYKSNNKTYYLMYRKSICL